MNEDFFTVSELNQLIKDVLNSGIPRPVWITGEIQNYNRNRTKRHVFFELCEKNPDSNDIVARIGLVIFANRKPSIEMKLKKSENAFELKDDIEVKFLCRVDFYGPHGAMRLIVEDIDPTYTLGKIAQDRQRILALLKKKGTLEINKKLGLSPVPLNVGLITAYDSAAYNDFMDELKASGLGFQIFLKEALMQGKDAESSIVKALKMLYTYKHLDCIIITRGGGSIADLACFDSQLIAETIAESPLPVLTGIGHEINTSIADLTAHTFAKTPTAIAQFLVTRIEDYKETLDELGEEAMGAAQEWIAGQKDRLHKWVLGLQGLTTQYFRAHHEQLIRYQEDIKRLPIQMTKNRASSLEGLQGGLLKTIQLRFTQARTKINGHEKLVELASPVKILKRGFSITRNEKGDVLKKATQVKSNEKLVTQLEDGEVTSVVS